MARRLIALLVAVAGFSAGAVAQEMNFDRLDAICGRSAARPPTALAQRVAAQARQEHRIFGGHEIDASGRIRRFGRIEAEGASGTEADGVPVADLPWRHVLRYWETLSGEAAAANRASGAQTVTSYGDALRSGPEARVNRREIPLRTLLDAIGSADLSAMGESAERVREALRQSVVRASLVDVAWSAAFVSSVMKDAGVPSSRFVPSSAHIGYIAQAAQSAHRESRGGDSQTLYRACDPSRVRPQAGDLICYHRHGRGTPDSYPRAGPHLFRRLVGEIAEGRSPISRSHCDVVTEVDLQAKKMRTVGGNVQQAVTARTLKLTQANVLSPNQGKVPCIPSRRPGPDEPNCNLNAQEWFVLLQARD